LDLNGNWWTGSKREGEKKHKTTAGNYSDPFSQKRGGKKSTIFHATGEMATRIDQKCLKGKSCSRCFRPTKVEKGRDRKNGQRWTFQTKKGKGRKDSPDQLKQKGEDGKRGVRHRHGTNSKTTCLPRGRRKPGLEKFVPLILTKRKIEKKKKRSEETQKFTRHEDNIGSKGVGKKGRGGTHEQRLKKAGQEFLPRNKGNEERDREEQDTTRSNKKACLPEKKGNANRQTCRFV